MVVEITLRLDFIWFSEAQIVIDKYRPYLIERLEEGDYESLRRMGEKLGSVFKTVIQYYNTLEGTKKNHKT